MTCYHIVSLQRFVLVLQRFVEYSYKIFLVFVGNTYKNIGNPYQNGKIFKDISGYIYIFSQKKRQEVRNVRIFLQYSSRMIPATIKVLL